MNPTFETGTKNKGRSKIAKKKCSSLPPNCQTDLFFNFTFGARPVRLEGWSGPPREGWSCALARFAAGGAAGLVNASGLFTSLVLRCPHSAPGPVPRAAGARSTRALGTVLWAG